MRPTLAGMCAALLLSTTACGGSGSSSAGSFQVHGSVRVSAGGSGRMSRSTVGPTTVTHVIAVNPGSSDGSRVVAPVAADGSFALSITGQRPWLLVFVNQDGVARGDAMVVGVLEAQASGSGLVLHTLAPATQVGSADLGTVTIDPTTGAATSSLSYDQLLAALQLSASSASALAAMDGVCLRYVNPDIDGDGIIDGLQGRDYLLDFHTRFDILSASAARLTPADLVNRFATDAAGVTAAFSSVSPAVAWPAAVYSGSTAGASLTVTDGGGVVVGSWSGSDFYPISWGSGSWTMDSIYPMLTSAAPSGTYVMALGQGAPTLTFTRVSTLTADELAANDGRLMPFLRVNTLDQTATGRISGVDYTWKRYQAAGGVWVDASADEVRLVTNDNGGYVSLYDARYSRSHPHLAGFHIPNTSTSGTIPWVAGPDISLTGMTADDMAAFTADLICDVGLSYDDKLGMRIFAQFASDCPIP
jgi:hypothetical protein